MYANLKKTKGNGDSVTQIVAVPEAAKSDTSYMFLIFLFFQSFSFFNEFQKTQGTGDSLSDFVAVPEAAKSDTSYMILIFSWFASFSNFFATFNEHKVPEILGPILLPSWRRQKTTHPIGF